VYPERENKLILPPLPLVIWAPCKERWMWAGAVIFASVTCSLQFAKASAATLPQQEKNNSANFQRGGANISGFICTVASWSSRRRPFGENLSMAVALRRALQHWRTCGAQNIGVGLRRPYRGQVCGGVLGAMSRIAPPQPNEARARFASRFSVTKFFWSVPSYE
jgi:hypothetical protein